jgi:putative acetyltransferase
MSPVTEITDAAPVVVRPESRTDQSTVRLIHIVAFPSSSEALLVDDLRILSRSFISLVAEAGSSVVGHILFSPATLTGHSNLNLMALAPMAVLPEWQRRGVGTQLVLEGLAACRERGVQACVVIGHPDYYSRFGFQPAANFGLSSGFDVSEEFFMAMELVPDALQGRGGQVRYHPLFERQ